MNRQTDRERQAERETDGQTDRQTGRQTDRQTHRQTDRPAGDDLVSSPPEVVSGRVPGGGALQHQVAPQERRGPGGPLEEAQRPGSPRLWRNNTR